MCWILAVEDCFTDSSPILVFWFYKNCIILANFQSVDCSASWQTSFNFNHTLHAGTLSSTGYHSTVAALLARYSRRRNILFVFKKLCCHKKLTNKIKPPILRVDNRLVEQCWGWISRMQKWEIMWYQDIYIRRKRQTLVLFKFIFEKYKWVLKYHLIMYMNVHQLTNGPIPICTSLEWK